MTNDNKKCICSNDLLDFGPRRTKRFARAFLVHKLAHHSHFKLILLVVRCSHQKNGHTKQLLRCDLGLVSQMRHCRTHIKVETLFKYEFCRCTNRKHILVLDCDNDECHLSNGSILSNVVDIVVRLAARNA